jgi:hypothetical protein
MTFRSRGCHPNRQNRVIILFRFIPFHQQFQMDNGHFDQGIYIIGNGVINELFQVAEQCDD